MNYKKYAKEWIDANVHDGEDRSGCVRDYATFNPDDLQELVDDLLDDLIPKIGYRGSNGVLFKVEEATPEMYIINP